jgi:hypothetical protein
MKKLTRIAEDTANRAGLPRRRFLAQLGKGAMTTVGALAGFFLAHDGRSSTMHWMADLTGACIYTESGVQYCQELTQAECESIDGSTWNQGLPCPFSL